MEAIIAKHINKKFNVSTSQEGLETVHALKNISFNIQKGEIVGVIGKNGAGKTILLRTISGIYKQESGLIKTAGKLISLIGVGYGVHDRLTMRDNIYLCCAFFGLTRKEAKQRFADIVNFTELQKYVDVKLYGFSTGMKMRLIVACAIYAKPDILLLDEVTSNTDKDFLKKIEQALTQLAKKGTTILIVSHDMDMIEKCNRALLIQNGVITFDGEPQKAIQKYIEN